MTKIYCHLLSNHPIAISAIILFIKNNWSIILKTFLRFDLKNNHFCKILKPFADNLDNLARCHKSFKTLN